MNDFVCFFVCFFQKSVSTQKRKIAENLRFSTILVWSEWRDLNSRPLDPQSSALPTAPHPDIQFCGVLFDPANAIITQNIKKSSIILKKLQKLFISKSKAYAVTPYKPCQLFCFEILKDNVKLCAFDGEVSQCSALCILREYENSAVGASLIRDNSV